MKVSKKTSLFLAGFIVIITIFVLLFTLYNDVKKRTIADFNNHQMLLAEQAAKGIQQFIGYYNRELTNYSKVEPVKKFDDFINVLFKHYYQINENIILTISRIDADGKIAFTYPPNPESIGTDITNQEHIQTIMKTHQPVISEVFMAVQGYRCIAYHVPVMDGETYAGSIAVLIPFEDIAKTFLENIQTGNNNDAWMISEKGTELYCRNSTHIGHSVTSVQSHSLSMIEKMKKGEKGTLEFYTTNDNKKIITAFAPVYIANSLWSIAISSPESNAISTLKSFQIKIIIVSAILFIFALIYAYYLIGAIRIVQEEEKRKQVENALRESEEKFREMANLLPQIIYETDLNGNLTYVNQKAYNFFQYSHKDFKSGINALNMIIPQDREKGKNNMTKIFTGKSIGNDHEYTALKKDGSTFPVLIYSNPIIKDNKPIGMRGIIVDITDRKNAEKQIEKSLKEKEVLLKEIHHRVKNNLNVISSLLSLQASKISNKDQAITAFKESRNRVFSIALVHEQLYKTDDFSRVNMKSYIENISRELKYIFAPDKQIKYNLQINNILLDVNHAIPCGLILNELITNAFKHAFPNGNTGTITVHFESKEDHQFEIRVTDNGVGLPSEIDIENNESLGLNLVSVLAKQIDGKLQVERNNGTTFEIRFRLDTKTI